ncbi:MAG TPA: peptide transporter [Bacteroidetes bacterium]|nr:peptide transporter [Bacteroidota bacterium]
MNKERVVLWKKFRKNRLAFFGLLFIALTVFLSLFAVVLSPDNAPQANTIHLALAAKKPGFKVDILKVPINPEPETNWYDFMLGFPAKDEQIPVLNWNISGDSLEYTAYYDEESLAEKQRIPLSRFGESGFEAEENLLSKRFWLGTDRFGRDMLSRMLIGARISISVGLIAVCISMFVGIFLGSLAAYYGGKIDAAIQWLMNVIWSLPTLLLVIAFALALGKGLWQIFFAIGMSMWVDVARLVRGQVLGLKEKEFVEAARVLGLSDMRILFRHILPNLVGPLTVVAAANFASAILLEAGLSFLGLGVQAPSPSWGQMIKEHYGYIVLDSAYLAIIPGVAIMLLVMSFNFVGNGLRDSLDVKLK